MCDVQMNGGNGAGEATESPSHVLRETEPGVEVEQGGRCVTPQKAGRRCLKRNSHLGLFPPSARASRPSVSTTQHRRPFFGRYADPASPARRPHSELS